MVGSTHQTCRTLTFDSNDTNSCGSREGSDRNGLEPALARDMAAIIPPCEPTAVTNPPAFLRLVRPTVVGSDMNKP